MDSSNSSEIEKKPSASWLIVAAIVLVIFFTALWLLMAKNGDEVTEQTTAVITPQEVEEPEVEEQVLLPEPEPEIPVEEIIEQETVITEPEIVLPTLAESDTWLKEKLTSLTWRKELLKLIIDEDMVRRLVVFTDNFAQGSLAYDYSPLITPETKFSALKADSETQWQWDEASTQRFRTYVDLLRSFEPESLATWYFEAKPLIDEAYSELGYPDDDFTDTLQDAITRVLDMELPKETLTLKRPSVMYQYQNESIETLPSADKLLLRLGRENLLVVKSFLLELSDALARANEQ